MSVIIRKAEIEDSERVGELLFSIAELHYNGRPDIFKRGNSKYTREEFGELLKNVDTPVFVAVDDEGYVIGYVFCQVKHYRSYGVLKDHDSLYIDDLCVDENFRGHGTGRMLFNYVREYAEKLGVFNIELNVWEFNKSAMDFYKKCGFETQRRFMEIVL